MKKLYSIWFILLLLFIIGITVTSCGSPSPLVGKWQPNNDEGYIEFFNNGTFEIWSEDETITGTYEETGNNQITLTADGQNPEYADENEQITLEYSFSGNELTLTDGITPVSFIKID